MVTSIKMLDATTGWATGYGEADVEGQASRVLLTTDGGNTWSDVTPPTSPGEHIEYYFGDNNHAWATEIFESGLVKLWRTQDGGQTWLCNEDIGDILSGTGINPRSVQLTFVDSQTGWMLASGGTTLGSGVVTILATQDGGESWKVVQAVDGNVTSLPLNGRKDDISFITRQVGWVGGYTMSSITYLYKTTDGGYSWQSVALPPPIDKPALFPYSPHTPAPEKDSEVVAHTFLTSAPHFSSPQTGFLVVQFVYSPENKCGAIAYVTANGGQTWTGYLLPPKDLDDGGPCENINLDFVNAQVGWYIGSKTNNMGDVQHYQLYQTQNGGQTWTLLTDLVWTGQIDFVDDQNGWAVATDGYTGPSPCIESECMLMRTSDGGKTWQEMKPQIVE